VFNFPHECLKVLNNDGLVAELDKVKSKSHHNILFITVTILLLLNIATNSDELCTHYGCLPMRTHPFMDSLTYTWFYSTIKDDLFVFSCVDNSSNWFSFSCLYLRNLRKPFECVAVKQNLSKCQNIVSLRCGLSVAWVECPY
jgi:hypothetical protein